jgi:hypothetical protein
MGMDDDPDKGGTRTRAVDNGIDAAILREFARGRGDVAAMRSQACPRGFRPGK